jgi:hypothetical protein
MSFQGTTRTDPYERVYAYGSLLWMSGGEAGIKGRDAKCGVEESID